MKQIQKMMYFVFVLFCGAFAQAQLTGSGTTNYLPLWTGGNTLGNSRFYQSGGNVGLDTTSPQWALDVAGHINTSAGYRIAENLVLAVPASSSTYPESNLAVGYESATSMNDTSFGNTAVGTQSLQSTTSGYGNTATGWQSLQSNTDGIFNSAFGNGALGHNTSGTYNTAVGYGALSYNTAGSANTAVGSGALQNEGGGLTGFGNTAVGVSAGTSATTGNYNTLLGYQTGSLMTTGSSNISVGWGAGGSLTTGESNVLLGSNAGTNLSTGSYNIEIGNNGASGDSGIIRIGTGGQQTSFFAAGIRGVATGENNAVGVVIDSNGQLGTVSSSRRFKTDIQDMGEASHGLLRLRPVTFRYRKPYADGSQPMQYGLIAEEVADVFPDLVAYGNDGQPESVKYQLLDSMLLNELQRQQAEIQDLREKLDRVEALLSSTSPSAQMQSAKDNSNAASIRGKQQ